ncbi:uncharacterized protein LOC114358061 [Ostrinia furnacalis]|uniref:uncharacterized protein LOC114358061 n=1 Tax=Ostrinia furnacalis TaxID=93504 RepID=UPI00103C2426|nr:uncharacterized protein LOC114358061 [Ostrinia furnacalis]
MTLTDAILKKAHSPKAIYYKNKYISPPPELEECVEKKKTKRPYKYAHVPSFVDTAPPRFDPARLGRHLPEWTRRTLAIYNQNMVLLTAIKRAHFERGRVDSRWKTRPAGSLQYYRNRADFYKRLEVKNRELYKRIVNTPPRLQTAAALAREWSGTRREIIRRAQAKFVLFPPHPRELIEDEAFGAPPGVRRPRVYLSLRVRNCAVLGELCAELFADACPATCRLFLQLLAGDGLGHGYVGTCFFSLRVRNCAVLGELCAELFADACPATCRLFLELLAGDGLGHGYVGTCFFRYLLY